MTINFWIWCCKFWQVALHFWGTGSRDLSFAAFWFLRTLCVQLGSDCLDECFKGLYKAYVMNCQFINAAKLQHIQFLRSLFVEFFMVDLPTAYQHAFVFIRQLVMILREALSMKTKVSLFVLNMLILLFSPWCYMPHYCELKRYTTHGSWSLLGFLVTFGPEMDLNISQCACICHLFCRKLSGRFMSGSISTVLSSGL